eukprot:20715-Eustigmatos_ZCMA.PRE.1
MVCEDTGRGLLAVFVAKLPLPALHQAALCSRSRGATRVPRRGGRHQALYGENTAVSTTITRVVIARLASRLPAA